jgi:hypothetical protein
LPTPQKDETKPDFIARCMAYPDMQKHPADQRYAICQSFWDNKDKKDKKSENESTKKE